MQVPAFGFGMGSVHALGKQYVVPFTNPHPLPFPSVVMLHNAKVLKVYVVQAAAGAHATPSNAHEAR